MARLLVFCLNLMYQPALCLLSVCWMFDLAAAGLPESPLPHIAWLPAATESAAAQLPAAGVKRHPAG